MEARELTQDEINLLASVGKVAKNWYAVMYDINQLPFAIFCSKESAESYRHQYCRTAIIQPWPLIIRDYSKPFQMKP